MYIFVAVIVILLRYVYIARCANCVFTADPSHVEAVLTLDKSDLSICDIIVKTCPKDIKTLQITSNTINVTYLFSIYCLSRDILPNVEKVSIKLDNLKISTLFHQSFSSNLRELYLNNCGIVRLPLFGSLYGFDKLEIIDLSQNRLQEVPQDLLMYSPIAKKLDLSSNRITQLPLLLNVSSSLRIDVSNNAFFCSCINAWVMLHVPFMGYKCPQNIVPCAPSVAVTAYAEESSVKNNSFKLSARTGAAVSFGCYISSSIPLNIFWITPVGIIPVMEENSEEIYTYSLEPIISKTSLTVSRSNSNLSMIIANARGHLSGIWYCVGYSSVKVVVSPAILLRMYSGFYEDSVYITSLYYGFSAMAVLLLVGIVGGTIRYCSETHCLRRPQPPFAYGGKTFIGVIPVPEVDGTKKQKRGENSQDFDYSNTLQFLVTGGRCNICNSYPSYWVCDSCQLTHYVERIFERIDHPDSALETVKYGLLSQDGEIKILGTSNDIGPVGSNPLTVRVQIPSSRVEARPLILTEAVSDSHEKFDIHCRSQEINSDANVIMSDIYACSSGCIVRLCLTSDYPDVLSIMNNICCHCSLRRKGADVKLVVSNEKLAEEYRQALDGLARAVESTDPAHFRERLEEFRSRLRRDVGHGVKVLRGEFQDLRAKSARGVASLRNQSSAAAQRMRAGISYSMEQMKDGMRSVAELCGASGTVGQTISVVSIYKDENDNTIKERLVSDFVF